MTRQIIEHLREHGPVGFSELPNEYLKVPDRIDGAARLIVVHGNAGVEHVAYLFDEHEPEEVVATWFELNADYVDEKGYDRIRGQFTALGRPWSQLASEHLEAPEKPWVPRKDDRVRDDTDRDDDGSPSLLGRLLPGGGGS